MAYKIRYNNQKHGKLAAGMRVSILSISFFVLFLFCARQVAAEELAVLGGLLLPQQSVEMLLQQLKAGEDFVQAVTIFCEDMLHGN